MENKLGFIIKYCYPLLIKYMGNILKFVSYLEKEVKLSHQGML